MLFTKTEIKTKQKLVLSCWTLEQSSGQLKGWIINTCGALHFLQKNPPKPGSGHFFEDSAIFSSRLHLLPGKSHDTRVSSLLQPLASVPTPHDFRCLTNVVQSEQRTALQAPSLQLQKECLAAYPTRWIHSSIQVPLPSYCHLDLLSSVQAVSAD